MREVAAPNELDAITPGAFASELAGSESVAVDGSAIEFIDSSGLQVLLEARQRLEHDGAQVVLRHPSAVLLRLLEVTSTDQLFTIER